MQDVQEYATKDLGEVCALTTSGQVIRSIHWKDTVAFFVFSDRPACEALQQRYYLGQLPVDARTYYDTLRGIKRRLYSQERFRG